MSFLIIGSNSFSGSNFVKYLIDLGHLVYGVSRSTEPNSVFLPYKWNNSKNQVHNFEFKEINLNHDLDKLMKYIDEKKPKYIINFAAQGMVAESWNDPLHWYKTNLISQVAFHNELKNCKYLEKYLHVTTPEVYGTTDNGWIKENFNFNPSTPYAVSRAACDMHLKSFFDAYSFPVVFTRAANVYGPGQQLYRIIPRTILSCLTGKALYLHGGGTSVRAFVHIKDVAKASLSILHHAPIGTSWHISSNKGYTIRKIVEKICDLTNVNFSKIVKMDNERLGKDQTYLLDSTSLRKEFDWSEEYSLEKGLIDTINWVSDNLDLFKTLDWNYIHKI